MSLLLFVGFCQGNTCLVFFFGLVLFSFGSAEVCHLLCRCVVSLISGSFFVSRNHIQISEERTITV